MIEKILKTLRTLFEGDANEEKQKLLRENILTDFKLSFHTYEAFSVVIHKLVEALLVKGGYKYQLHVRVKDIKSLEEKIKRKQLLGKNYYRLNEIEDLVGIRIIFYSELDKKSFIESLKKEISGVMRIEEREKENGYSATHIIASFGRRRLKLVEYKPFSGLKCEIQITTAVHHAWAELEHDLIYKDINGLEKVNPEKYHIAKKKLSEVLERHIVKASDEFDEVIKEIKGSAN